MKRIPAEGLVGLVALKEAASTEYVQVMDLVRSALQARYDAARVPGVSYSYFSIEAMFADRVIVCKDGRYWKFPYSIDDKNLVALSEPVEVLETFTDVALKEALAGNTVLVESKDDGKTWDVVILKAGNSGNGNYYTDASLKESIDKFEGAKVYAKSNDDHLAVKRPDIGKLAGWISDVRFVDGKGADSGHLAGRFNWDGMTDLRETVSAAWSRGKKDLVGLSIDAVGKSVAAKTQQLREGIKRVVQSIIKVRSVDLIVDPAAGGALVRLVEATASEEQDPMKEMMLAAIKAKRPNADLTNLTEAKILELYGEVLKESANAGADVVTREEMQNYRRLAEARAAAGAKVGATTLPAPAKNRLLARLNAIEDLTQLTEAKVDEAIKAERAEVVALLEATGADDGKVKLYAGDIEVEDRSVKVGAMLDAFFDPAHKDHRSAQSFKECYIEMTGDRKVTGRLENVNRTRLAESIGSIGNLRESLDSTTFSNALGTSITRRMIGEYRANARYDGWRKICNVVPVQDFRTQTRVNIGGYGDLPAVTQSSPYLSLTSPTDAAATYTPTKRGGTEDVTLEMIKNDDVGAIRLIPVRMARSAKRTLSKFVFDFIRTNPTLYDGVAFFHASHGNLGSTAFSAAEYGVVRTAMLKQAERDSSDRMGIGPAGILCPPDLESAVWTAFQRGTNLDKDFIQSLQPEIIPVWYWTDATDWAAYADPMDIPGIEVGFLDGQEEPELFVQDAPNQGSMFSNDKVTYKIRHIYGGAVVPDGYKAFYKEVVAG